MIPRRGQNGSPEAVDPAWLERPPQGWDNPRPGKDPRRETVAARPVLSAEISRREAGALSPVSGARKARQEALAMSRASGAEV